ncbi:MAG TPA: DUF2844 domain-containing protein [Nitrospiria bacterium]|nr:DUF2844 domain-containing protein [Nitrospiria bacterium]
MFFLICLIVPAKSALAVLGEGKKSVELDHQTLHGDRMSIPRAGYSIETIQSAGLTIKEYLAPNGTIFAVTWEGNRFPDLVTLFGAYYNEYQQASDIYRKQTKILHGAFHLTSSRLVVQTAGRSPHLRGRAYLPSYLPPGLPLKDIE